MEKEKKNGWKVFAIILLILLIVENLFLIKITLWAWSATEKNEQNENYCVYTICSDEKYESYTYDIDTQICKCYIGSNPIYQEYIK